MRLLLIVKKVFDVGTLVMPFPLNEAIGRAEYVKRYGTTSIP